MLRTVGLLSAFGASVNLEGPAVRSEAGAEAMQEEGAHMLTIDSILPYVLSHPNL